jgi:hypothetical protein
MLYIERVETARALKVRIGYMKIASELSTCHCWFLQFISIRIRAVCTIFSDRRNTQFFAEWQGLFWVAFLNLSLQRLQVESVKVFISL